MMKKRQETENEEKVQKNDSYSERFPHLLTTRPTMRRRFFRRIA